MHNEPQPNVKVCPECSGELQNVASRNHQPPKSHAYRCLKCRVLFEINRERVHGEGQVQ